MARLQLICLPDTHLWTTTQLSGTDVLCSGVISHQIHVQVEVIRFNLLLADWGDEDHFESLLAEKNSKWGREYLSNVKCATTCIL
jgi:hypothetical protein